MIINGVYEKTLYRDEKMGDTLFTIVPRLDRELLGEYGNIVCRGVIPHYPAKTPLRLVLSKNDDGSYSVWNTCLNAFSEESTTEFLLSGYMTGIGPVRTGQFLKKYGYDIFNDSYTEEFPDIAEKLKKLITFEKLYKLIERHGGNFHNAYRVFKKYGIYSLSELEKDPYKMSDILPFEMIDSYAKSIGIDKYDMRRTGCILKKLVSSIESSGNTCEELGRFFNKASRAGIEPFLAAGLILSDKNYFISDNEYVYDSHLYLSEENIAFNISRLMTCSMELGDVDEGILREIEKETGSVYDAGQREAFNLLTKTGVKIITGGPGTGKTTVINGIIKYIHKKFPKSKIALAAPTANAARRMREKTEENATTLHKLFEIQPFADSDNFAFKRISEDFLIIDESSFIDTRLASIIFQSVEKHTTVILVGDVDQLPSVGAGNVFRDMIESECIPVVRLEKIFRQSNGSSIIENSVLIKKGNAKLIKDDSFEIIRFEDEESLFNEAVSMMKKYYNIDNPYSVRLYTPVRKRKYHTCTHNFNRVLQEYYSEKGECFTYGYTKFYIGDPVIFTRNNYGTGYCNGDEGKIIRILENDDGKYGVVVSLNESVVEIKDDDLLDMELSFAITTHKSQGSECDTAIVIVPSNPGRMLYRSIIYVAATRARKRTIILTEGDALERAIRNDSEKKRKTGLKRLIFVKTHNVSP